MRKIIVSVISIFIIYTSFAQKNTTVDTTLLNTHSPKTATILSASLPGLGQIYNKNYWKVPVIYAGFAGLGYGFVSTQKNYKEFKKVYNDFRDPFLQAGKTPPTDTLLSVFGQTGYYPENVRAGRDYYRRYRDLCVIGMGTWYVLNILEAYVYANLYDFDTSDDLSFRIQPYIYPSVALKPVAGLSFSLTF